MTAESYFRNTYGHYIKHPNHIYPTQDNSHDIIVLSPEALSDILKEQDFRQSIPFWLKKDWENLRERMLQTASYYANVDDARTATLLIAELGGTRAYIKDIRGKPHIIMKGNAKLRANLTSAKYGVHNPKVVKMGLGIEGAKHAVRTGTFITIILLTVYRVADYIIRDEATLGELIGSTATDIAKVGLAAIASYGVLMISGVTAFAVGPIIAIVAIGTFVSMGLSKLDDYLEITKQLNKAIDESMNH